MIEKLFLEKTIEANGSVLLEIKEKSFSDLIDEIKPSKVVGLSSKGQKHSFENMVLEMPENCCLVVGGFQKGHFSDKIQSRINQLISIEDSSFEAHVVVARILYEYEKTIFM